MVHMNLAPIVRAALPTDAVAIHSLYLQLVDDDNVNVTASEIQAFDERGNGRLFVCESGGGHIIATALVCVFCDVMYGSQPFAVVYNVVVNDKCRGRGVGRILMQEVEQFCLSRNCSKMMLLSSVLRADAHRFFERVGFLSDVKRGFVKYRRQFSQRALQRALE